MKTHIHTWYVLAQTYRRRENASFFLCVYADVDASLVTGQGEMTIYIYDILPQRRARGAEPAVRDELDV